MLWKKTLGCDLFSRVGACGRRPSVGSFTGDGIACTVEKKLYGGRGLGLVGDPQAVFLVFKLGGFNVRI